MSSYFSIHPTEPFQQMDVSDFPPPNGETWEMIEMIYGRSHPVASLYGRLLYDAAILHGFTPVPASVVFAAVLVLPKTANFRILRQDTVLFEVSIHTNQDGQLLPPAASYKPDPERPAPDGRKLN